MDNSHNEPKSNATSFKSHLLQTYGQETSETFKHCSNLVLKASKNSCHVSFLKCCRDFNLTPKGLRPKGYTQRATPQEPCEDRKVKGYNI